MSDIKNITTLLIGWIRIPYWLGISNSDLQVPDRAKNGADPQPWYLRYLPTYLLLKNVLFTTYLCRVGTYRYLPTGTYTVGRNPRYRTGTYGMYGTFMKFMALGGARPGLPPSGRFNGPLAV